MALNPSAEELYTVVENMTDVERVVGFLGPRGMTLGPNEIVAVPGDLVASLGAQAQRGQRRKFDALQRTLQSGRLRINSRPAPILYDPTAEEPVSFAVVAGALGTVVPAYGDGDSESYAAV